MEASDATVREIMRIVRKYVDRATLYRIVEELLDVRGNKSFRDTVEIIAREIQRGGGQ